MNRKISTRVGAMTGICIMAFILILKGMQVGEKSPIIFLQFLIMFIGILLSCFLLYKHYADIKFLDAFTHCVKTSITALIMVLIGNTILFFIFSKNEPFSAYTMVLMKTIFAFTVSGLLSSFFTSLIFNTFTKKQ